MWLYTRRAEEMDPFSDSWSHPEIQTDPADVQVFPIGAFEPVEQR